MDYIKNKKIMAVDDEPQILEMIKTILSRSGFANIYTASNSKDALKTLKELKPDMAVLDVMLPDMDGFSLMREIRNVSDIPVLFLTAKGEAADKFTGFNLGADDYMVKPFLAKELVYRICAILKRTYKDDSMTFELSGCTVYLDNAEVSKDGKRLALTSKEHSILLKLYENADKIVTIGTLCEAACGDNYFGYENTLMTHIRHIREKIEKNPSSPVSLVTVKGLGYKLIVNRKCGGIK